MKSKINSPNETCFKLPTGYSIDMNVVENMTIGVASFLNNDTNNSWISAICFFNNLQSGYSISLTNSLYN